MIFVRCIEESSESSKESSDELEPSDELELFLSGGIRYELPASKPPAGVPLPALFNGKVVVWHILDDFSTGQ